jgi:hypothetical protein
MKKVVIDAGRSVPAWAFVIVGVMFLLTVTIAAEPLPKSAGIWLSRHPQRRLSDRTEEQLTQNLRKITGLPELGFGKDGRLVLGNLSTVTGGSGIARQILSCALGSGHVFIIEDHCGSASVNFGQMDEGTNYEDLIVGCQFLIWRVRLDFDDFREMEAPPELHESFNAGITMLHELLHGLGYRDAKELEEIGECEELINQARTELGLPVREQYFGDALHVTRHFSTVRLKFSSQAKPEETVLVRRKRRKAQYLFFLLPAPEKP